MRLKSIRKKVYDYIELDSNYSVFEIAVPEKWMGKTIQQANPRAKYGINILTVKKNNKYMPTPTPDTVFEKNDKIVVFGNTEQILLFTNRQKNNFSSTLHINSGSLRAAFRFVSYFAFIFLSTSTENRQAEADKFPNVPVSLPKSKLIWTTGYTYNSR